MKGTWHREETLIRYVPENAKVTNKIAAFDFDSTLVEQKSGKTFPVDGHDWKLLFENDIRPQLFSDIEEGYTIIIFTNQSGISKKKITYEMLKQRLEGFMKEVEVPFWVYAATHGDKYRKPGTAMWSRMCEDLNVKPNLQECIYVGDAAGRFQGWHKNRKKDFSCSDRKFAWNVGIKFQTPEEYFLGAEPTDQWEWGK